MKARTPRILVVDDEEGMREFLSIMLEKAGYAVRVAKNGEEALRETSRQPFDLVITDLRMPVRDGVSLLEVLRKRDPDLPVILVTAYASADSAIQTMKLGAFDYVTKPFRVEEITALIEKALAVRREQAAVAALPPPEAAEYGPAGMIGRSPKMIDLYKLISRVANVIGTVLITGESGTGKELVARTLHRSSDRADKPFLAINCGAIPEQLLESELFGHVKGSFTGAVANKAGLFEVADGGTLFLDEIAETSPAIQVKLLRVLQDRAFRRVGGTEDIAVNVRLIAATNQDLGELIQKGQFREDLFYRLNVIPIPMPPLRERREDIPLLTMSFLARFSRLNGKTVTAVSPEVMQALAEYDWPGNVRELENAIERAVALEPSTVLTLSSLPEQVLHPRAGREAAAASGEAIDLAAVDLPREGVDLDRVVGELEERLLREALDRVGGSQVRAARLLGINLRSLRYRVRKYGLIKRTEEDHQESQKASGDQG